MKCTSSSTVVIAAAMIGGLSIPSSKGDLVSYWPLDETNGEIAADAVSNNDAVWQNAGMNLSWVDGRVGGAAKLTDAGGAGANNYFEFTIPELIGANAITIAAWIDPEPQTSSGYNGIFMTRRLNNATISWGLAFQNDGGGANHLDTRVNEQATDSGPNTLPPDGGWFHVSVVWDGVAGTHKQYINGAETGSNSGALRGQIMGTSGPWFIGYDDCCGGGREFNGTIDDVGMWDAPLSAEEIAKIYDDGLSGMGIEGAGIPFQITGVVINTDDASVTLTWNSDARKDTAYTVLFSDDLSAPVSTWQDVDDGVPTGGETTTFTTPPGFASFARRYFVIRRN